MATNNNPFQRYLDAIARNNERTTELPDYSRFNIKNNLTSNVQTQEGLYEGSVSNAFNDAAVSAAKGVVLVPQVLAGLADIAGYVGTAGQLDEYGQVGKLLESAGVDFKTTQDYLSSLYSNAYQRQQQELQALGEFSTDKSLGDNLAVLADKAGYVFDNPALAFNTVVESVPLIALGGALGNLARGGTAAVNAARAEAATLQGAAQQAAVRKAIASGAIGEGAVSAGILQEDARQHSDTGLTTPEQTLLSTAAGLGVGAVGYLGGRAAIRAGVADVDTALINSDPLRAAYLKNNPVSHLVGGAVREGLEEVPQENLENFAENINNTRGNGNILYGAADSTVLGFAAGALTGGAVNLPTEAGNAFKDIATGLNKAKETIKDKVTLKSYEELSNPDSDNYDPVKAFNLQAKNLLSDDEALRTQAEVSVDELTTGLETNIDTVLQRKTQLDKEINDIDPLDYSDEAKVKNLALYEESKSIDKLLPSLLTQYEQLAIAKDDLEKNKEKINGTTYTEEQAKQDIAVLNQEPVQQSVIWNYEGNNIPVIIVSSAKVNEAGEEVIDISYDFDGIPLEVTVPTKELNLPDTTAQEQAIANVTKHFSKFSPEELEVISKSPYLSEQQRNSLRQLSAVKQSIAASGDIGKVRDHILNGLKGATPRDSHRGMNTYTELVNTGIRNNDERLVNIALTELGDFAQHHTDKAKVINEAFAQVKQGETIRVARTKDGVWGMVKNPTTAKQNGEYDIHVNSNKTSANRPVGLIDSINQEVSIITDHYNALRGIAENFGGVSTPNAIEPVVAQDSTDKNVPSADVNTGNIDTKEYTNHSGGAYGADTLWDTVGRSLGFNNHNHYRDSNNTTLSAKLKQAGVKAVELSKKQMETARNEVQKLLNRTYPDTVQGNLQVRNYYQVANSDGVYAIAALNGNNAVKGGTNTAVQLGIKLGKPVYVWDINTEQWYKFDTNSKTFKATKTPTLTKNFAGVGTRDIENYNVLKNGKWVEREAYVGDEKAQKAQQAVKDVYEKTLAQNTSPVQTAETTPNNLEPIGLEASEIYSKLGTKTISGNVVQQSWGKLKTATKAVYDKAVISTRIPNTDEHFGNPFSSDTRVLANNPQLIKTNSTRESVERYIDWVINSKEARAAWIREQLQSGKLKGKSILYYTELNEASHANALDYLINKYDWGTVTKPVEAEESSSTPSVKETQTEATEAAKQSKSARRPRLEEAYAEVFAKPIEDWDANDFAIIGAQAYYRDGKKHTDKEHDADNSLVQKLVKKIINDGIKRGDSTTDIMSKVMFSAFDATFTIRQSGVDALEAYIEMRKEQVNSTTNPTVESNDITEVVADSDVTIKIEGNITEVFNSKSGLTHKVPTVLLNKMLSVKYYLEQVSSVESGILKPKEKEYISKLLSVFTQLRPNVVVSFLTDFSKIDKKIAEALPTSVGKSVDGNKIYIDVTNKTPVDMLELLTHEYHHAVTIETLDKTPLNTSYHIELAKVHEAVIKYLEDNPTLSAKARKRLSYALTAPAELLTVGTTEPIAIASLRKIDMGNGKTAYTVIMEQSIAIMKEQYSKTFTTEIEAQLNDLLSRTDRNLTTDEASSTKDSSIPSSEAASTTSDNTRTSDESIELQPDSNTESAATEVVNTESQLDTTTNQTEEEIIGTVEFTEDEQAEIDDLLKELDDLLSSNQPKDKFSIEAAPTGELPIKKEVSDAVAQARQAVRDLLVQLNFKFVDSPDVNLTDIERIASKYLVNGTSNNDPAFLGEAAKALSYAIYFDLDLKEGSTASRAWLEQSLFTWLKTGEIPKVHKGIWAKVIKLFYRIMAVFSGKEFENIDTRLENTLNKIVNGGNFSLKPKEGYAPLVFQEEMDNNPLAVQSLLTLIKSGIKFALTGSIAYSDQVPVYRDKNKPLHDMDFVLSPKDVQAAYDYFTQSEPENWGGSFTLYDVQRKGNRILGFAIVPKGYVIKNGKSGWNTEEKAPERSYDVYNKVTGIKEGSYYFLGGKKEVFTGVAGITIDLLADKGKDTVTQTFKDTVGKKHSIEVSTYVGGFAAKLEMMRYKDIVDFVNVIPPVNRVLSKSKEVTLEESNTQGEAPVKPTPLVSSFKKFKAKAVASSDTELSATLSDLEARRENGDKSPVLQMEIKAYSDEVKNRLAAKQPKDRFSLESKTLSLKEYVDNAIKNSEWLSKEDVNRIQSAKTVNEVISILASLKDVQTTNKSQQKTLAQIRQEILAEVKAGNLTEEQSELLFFLVEKNPALFDSLNGFNFVDTLGGSAAGKYSPVKKLVTIARDNKGTPTLLAHEMLHHMEAFLPASIKQGIVKAWRRALVKAIKSVQKGSNEELVLRALVETQVTGDTTVLTEVLRSVGGLPNQSLYRLFNPSEFWAENASELLQDRMRENQSWVTATRNYIKELYQKLKSIFGLDNNAAILQGLRLTLSGKTLRDTNVDIPVDFVADSKIIDLFSKVGKFNLSDIPKGFDSNQRFSLEASSNLPNIDKILTIGSKLGNILISKGVTEFERWSQDVLALTSKYGISNNVMLPYLVPIYSRLIDEATATTKNELTPLATITQYSSESILNVVRKNSATRSIGFKPSTTEETEVVNTAGLSVLQGLSKEVIAEERTKPLSTINLVKAYFSQKLNKDETKGTNPLVAVNNFMQSLPKTFNEVRAYVSNYLEPSYKITDEQLKQLEQFRKFELGFSTIASNLFSNRYINNKYAPDAPTQNVILYFRDAKGNLDTNMLTAMAASAFQYLIVNGTEVGNKEEDVRKLLRLDAKAPLPYEVSSALQYVGADVKTVVRELGKSIYKSLGLSVDKQGDVDLQQRVELALGQLALDTLVESGYLKENLLDSTAITEISDAMIAAGYSTANTLSKVNKLTFVSSNVVFNDKGSLVINDEGKVTFEALKPVNVGKKEEVVLPTVEAIKEANEGTVSFLQDLFSTDNGYRMPELLEPTKFVQDSIRGTDAKVSEYQKELLTEAHKHASTMRKNTISVLNKLKGIGGNSKYLRQLINAWYDKESLEKVHILRRDSVIVAAEDIWNALENGLQWANIIAKPDGYAEFYSPQDVAQNSRMHTTATFFNEQANQVHRAMANKKEHNITLNIKSDSTEDLNNILRFFQAVGEGLEGLPLGSSINSQVPGYKFFTTDKVRGDHYVSSLLAYLFSEKTKPAIDAMITLIENDTIDTKQQEAISKFVDKGGMGIQSLQSLIAIAEYFKAIKDGKTNIEINTPFSSDGVNDGVASANILMGTATPELLQQVGMFLRQETGVQTESMQDNYMKGIEDYYVSFGNKIREALANLANEKIDKEWAKATLALFTKLQLSKDDMKAIRKIAKTWSVPFNYSAGKAALQRALARDFLENIYDQFESIGGEALDNRKAYAEAKGKKDNDSMAALEIAYAGLKRDVQTLETNIQNALGYGFLAPSSTKVRQVRGSLYRSLSDIKLPVSRPENLLSFTFNTGSVEIIEVITTSNLDKNGEETSSTKNSFVHTGRDAERIIEKYLMSASTAMFGKAAWEATEEFAGKFIASRDLFTEIQNSTFSLYNQLRNALIDAKIESKKDKTFGGYFTLTIAEMEEIDNKLLEFAPILKTVFSIKATSETDALASGLRLYDSTYTTSLPSKRPDLRQVITRYTKRDGTPATTTTNLGREVLEKGGVKNGATAIQSIDAFVSATVQAIFGILNAHDAAFFGLDKFVAGTLLQNETYLEAMTKYHFGLEHAESLLRSYKGLESVVQSLGLKKEYADTLSQLFEQVLLGEEVKDKTENVLLDETGTAILSGGIVGALNDMLLLEEKETFNSNGRDIEEVLEVLVKTLIAKDISKLNQLKNLHSVHHFSGEGGQVLVTEEHIKEMDKQIKLLKAKEKELLALITKEADGIAIDNKSITEYLTENKGKDIKYTVFKPYLELNSKPEHKAVLGLIEKLIPTGLTIRYQEQDIATEGYGNYDEKTNTITITAIPDSKVSIALVIHELLHSALAQRINTLEEAERTGNTKGLEKAIAALNSVKALRETIIGKDGLAYLELKKVIEGKAKGKSFKDYKIELETLRTSLNAKFDKENKDYANIVAQLKEVQANINEVNRFFGLVDKLKQEQKEAVIAQPTYTVATGAIDEAGNAVERVVTRLSIINKFENIHEFISYGLTDRRVQAVLAAIETPVNSEFKESTTKRLSNFVRDFVLKVANLLGLKGQNATLLVPFYIEVGKLIDEITQASVPPTPSNRTHQSTTDYNDSVNEMDSLTVMQGLPHSNSEFSQHLNNIITDSIGQLYKADDTARQRINEIQNLQASEARNAGFSLSAKEAIVQQALQLAVETYMLTNAGNLNISQLFKVFKEAKAKMNEESFHNGDWNTATRLERSIAKKKYDFIFDTTKKGFEARFISMALASEEVHNLLGFNTISPKPSKEKTWFDTANSWLKYAISWLANKYVKLNPSNPVHKQISQLVDNLVKLDIRSRQETVAIWEHAWNLIGKATTPLNVLAKASKDKLAANNFLLNSKYLPLRAVGAIAALDAKAVSESIPKAITSMRNELRPNERLGEAMNAMLEASAATGMRKVMDVLIRQGNQNAHERQNISDGTKKSILSWFKEPNKLTKRQHLATTNVILRADLQALTGKFELEEVMDLIGDEVTLNNEIKVLEQSIAKEANGNGMLVASKLLAKYMVTIIGGNGLVKNARAISVGLGTHYQQADVTNVDEALVENIDLLVSMYALKYTYQGDKDIVTSLYKKEPEALLGILNLHYGLVEQAKTLFKDNPLNFNKGWLPDIANPYKGIKYAESKEEVETLQSLGWQLITPTGLKKDPLDITETKYMMIHNDMAYQRIVSGAVDLGNPSRKGNEVASKWNGLLTPIVKGRNASSQQLSKIPYDKFDPFKQEGGLIAAYDTEGYVIGYSYEMEGSTRNSLLDRNNNFADLLGAYAGANFYKPVKEYQSKKVADVLFQDYKDNFKKNPNAYLKLSKDSKDPRVAEMWRMLPHDFKQRAIELYGKGEPIVIRNEAFLLAFGFKKYTVAEVFNKLAKDRNAAEKAFVIFANTLLGNPVANMFLKGTVADKAVKVEKAIQDIMRVVKDFIVIRSINVLWNNVLSNLFTLMAHGINPITAIKNWSFAVANVRAYQTQNAELIQLRNDLLAGKDVKQTEQRIGVLEAQLKRNPITKYVEAGLLSSIVEDVTIQDADYTYTSQFKQKVDNATGWIPNAVKTAGNWLILSPSTQGYQFLATTTQLSDFVAKYTLAEHLQKGGMKFDEAVLEASQTFINYDVPTSRGMQYANDIGLFMFTKFFLRIQAVLYKLLDKRMASVIGQQIAVDHFTNFQGVLDPLAVFHIGNLPFEASVFNAPSALFDVGAF